jgi:ubiquitin-protein ligase
MRKSPRDRRLNADYQSVEQLQAESSIFSFHAGGNPPHRYRLSFHGAGFQRDAKTGRVVVSERHEVLVELGAAYPRMVPNLAWQTPIFHPNISNNGVVCLGGYGTHWVPSLTLSEMSTMLWDMIRYKNFDTESPYNREAALWAKQQTEFKFPIDSRSIRDRVSGQSGKPPLDPERLVTRIVDRSPNRSSAVETGIEILESGVEIIDSGVEIIDSSTDIFEVGDDRQIPNDGILFLD